METRRILMRSLAVAVFFCLTVAADDKVYSCCTKVSTAKVTDPIIDIRLQHESLPCVKAVIFETERGDFCCDSKQRWVWVKVKQFFNKNLTSTPPPTSSISDQTRVGGSTQATDSSSVTNV
uniref:Chemokine interleukin-8-like domain-containing protein n=1 Tax=Sinocyclocheilus grahami TaxID=75366 RepID=A0A672MG29_SINGR